MMVSMFSLVRDGGMNRKKNELHILCNLRKMLWNITSRHSMEIENTHWYFGQMYSWNFTSIIMPAQQTPSKTRAKIDPAL